jgi:hypothetical protein
MNFNPVTSDIDEIKCNIFNTFNDFELNEFSIHPYNTFLCLALNLRSLKKYWNTLIAMIGTLLDRIDLLILMETNITKEEVELYNLSNFNKIYSCRETRPGGGIMIYAKHNINVKTIPHDFTETEAIIIELNIDTVSHTIAVFYRPPSNSITNFNKEIENWLNLHGLINRKNITLIGDINIDIHHNNDGSTTSNEYINILSALGFQMGIKEPTREEIYADRITSSCIDHVNTRISPRSIETLLIKSKIADHYIIGFKIFNIRQKISEYQTETIDIISSRITFDLIEQNNWNKYLNHQEPESVYKNIVKDFNDIYKQATIKITRKRQSNFHPWFNDEIKQNIRKKDNLWNRLKKFPNNHTIKTEYKRQRNFVTNLIRKEKRNYYYNKINCHIGDAKKTWNIINEILNKKKRSISSVISENFKLDDGQLSTLCNNFNEMFKNTIEEMNKSIDKNKFEISNMENKNIEDSTNTSLYFNKINIGIIEKVIMKLNTTAAPGADNIRPKDIKTHFQSLKNILLHLYNLILKSGHIPNDMKITILKPIYKSGIKNDTSNYRPIGAISILLKIFEYILHDRIMEYCMKNNILNENQYGFVPGKSTTQLLEKVAYTINSYLDRRTMVIAVLLDLSKAFDTIQHALLLKKLKNIGIGGQLFKLFENYFRDRRTIVRIGNVSSTQQI